MRRITVGLVTVAMGVSWLSPVASGQEESAPIQVQTNLNCTINFGGSTTVPAGAQGRFLESAGHVFPATVTVVPPKVAIQGRPATYRITEATVAIPQRLDHTEDGWLSAESFSFHVREVTNARFRFAGVPATGVRLIDPDSPAQVVMDRGNVQVQGEVLAEEGQDPKAVSPGPIVATAQGQHLVAAAPAVEMALDTTTERTISPHIAGRDIGSWWYSTSNLNPEHAFFTSRARITYVSTLKEVTDTAFLRCTPPTQLDLPAVTVRPAQPQQAAAITGAVEQPWVRLGDSVTVTGQVRDAEGITIPHAEVEVRSGDTQVRVNTNDNGSYRAQIIPTAAGWQQVGITHQALAGPALRVHVLPVPADITVQAPATMVPGEQQHAVIEVHDSQGQAYVDPELRVTINGQAPSTRPDASGTWTVPLHPTTAGDSVLRAWVGDYLSQEVVIPARPAPPTGQEQEPPEPPAAGSSSTDWRVILLVAAGLGGIVSLILRALGGQR